MERRKSIWSFVIPKNQMSEISNNPHIAEMKTVLFYFQYTLPLSLILLFKGAHIFVALVVPLIIPIFCDQFLSP